MLMENGKKLHIVKMCQHAYSQTMNEWTNEWTNEWMDECLTTPRHENYIGYWVSDNGMWMKFK